MKPKECAPARRVGRLVLLGIVVAAAQAATAAPPQLPAQDGLLVLPGVRVETAPRPVVSQPMRGAAGVRAYKDRETGQLRKATPEEQQEEALAPAAANDATGARVSVMAGGRKSAQLDESFMSYSVVRRTADGRLEAQCVTGESAAQHALHAGPNAKEARHAH